jgi:hypothetical protein
MSDLGAEEEEFGTSHCTENEILSVCLEADTNFWIIFIR